jgi:hypothetical protein
MSLSVKSRAAVAAPTPKPGPKVTVPLPVVRKARGISYGVQVGYADWQRGMRNRVVAED